MEKRGSLIVPFILVLLVIAVLAVFYFKVESESIKTLLLSLLIIVVLFGGGTMLMMLLQRATKLRKKLKWMETALQQEPLDVLKSKYLEIYALYMKLSEKDKQNFYARVTKVREQVEEQMKAEKKVEHLLEQAGKGPIPEQKENYDSLYDYYHKLSQKTQEKYYTQMKQIKEQLEKGTSS